MSVETLERVLQWLARSSVATLDITGGAPELHPYFQDLVLRARAIRPGLQIIDRCNLTVLLEPGQEGLAAFLAEQDVEITASLPCYSEETVDAQRGDGVYERSIRALHRLNALGYGRERVLNLVYNPAGATLPPAQDALEAAYRDELRTRHGIEFTRLFALANLPVARFAAQLRRQGQAEAYAELLLDNFNPAAVSGLMCRDTLSVGWGGEVYDCDFNQMLKLGDGTRLWDLSPDAPFARAIATGPHCYACTAGAGSSCGGALSEPRVLPARGHPATGQVGPQLAAVCEPRA